MALVRSPLVDHSILCDDEQPGPGDFLAPAGGEQPRRRHERFRRCIVGYSVVAGPCQTEAVDGVKLLVEQLRQVLPIGRARACSQFVEIADALHVPYHDAVLPNLSRPLGSH